MEPVIKMERGTSLETLAGKGLISGCTSFPSVLYFRPFSGPLCSLFSTWDTILLACHTLCPQPGLLSHSGPCSLLPRDDLRLQAQAAYRPDPGSCDLLGQGRLFPDPEVRLVCHTSLGSQSEQIPSAPSLTVPSQEFGALLIPSQSYPTRVGGR